MGNGAGNGVIGDTVEVELFAATKNEEEFVGRRRAALIPVDYTCGGCGRPVTARIVARATNHRRVAVTWTLCPCGAPSVFMQGPATNPFRSQFPLGLEFVSDPKWPETVRKLFDEASHCLSARAFTACAMLCRKILMNCACDHGAKDGLSFVAYVDYVTSDVLTMPKAKQTIEVIRGIGNDANHDIAFVTESDAHHAMGIVNYLLAAVYSLPDVGSCRPPKSP